MENKVGNFFLIGLMGSGKTTVGKQLALRMHKQFYDSDHEIVARMGVSITTIFEIEGEEKFRERESQVLADLAQKHNIVLATGGGIILREANRHHLQKSGIVIYLHANVDTILERTRFDRSRPLLQTENPAQKIQELYTQRDPLYREIADIIIDANEVFLPNLIKKVTLAIEQYQHNKGTK
jgi:shikimate kinase